MSDTSTLALLAAIIAAVLLAVPLGISHEVVRNCRRIWPPVVAWGVIASIGLAALGWIAYMVRRIQPERFGGTTGNVIIVLVALTFLLTYGSAFWHMLRNKEPARA